MAVGHRLFEAWNDAAILSQCEVMSRLIVVEAHHMVTRWFMAASSGRRAGPLGPGGTRAPPLPETLQFPHCIGEVLLAHDVVSRENRAIGVWKSAPHQVISD
jgi:hypothetical protein